MSEYKYISKDEFYSDCGVEGTLTTGIFKILKKDYDKRLIQLILLHHKTNEIETEQYGYHDGECFINEFSTYTEFYSMVLQGRPIYHKECLEEEILKTLANEGYINNGLLLEQHYYLTNHNDYGLQNNCYRPIIKDKKNYYTQDEMIKQLIKDGLIKEVAPNTYTK